MKQHVPHHLKMILQRSVQVYATEQYVRHTQGLEPISQDSLQPLHHPVPRGPAAGQPAQSDWRGVF